MNLKVKQQNQNELLSQITVLKQYTQALQVKNKQLAKQKEDLQTQLRNVKINFKTSSSLNENYKSNDSKQQTTLQKRNSLLQQDQLRQKYQKLLIDYNRLKNKARSTKINYDVYQKQNTSLSKQKYVLEEKIVGLQTEVKSAKSLNNSLLSGNKQFQKSFYSNQQNLNALNASMSYNQSQIRNLNSKIVWLQRVISQKNQEISQYQAEIREKNNEFGKMKVDIQNYYQKIAQLQNELNRTKLSNSRTYRQSQGNSQMIANLRQSVSMFKEQNNKLQQKNEVLQNRIQILQESNLNLTKELREKSAAYYPMAAKLSQTLPTQDQSMSSDIGYRLSKSILPNYQNQYVRSNNDNPPSYYLGQVQSRFITKKIVEKPPVIVRQNALYNNGNISVLSNNNNTRFKRSLSNDSKRYDSLQRKIQNLAVQNSKLRNVLVYEL